MKTPIPGLRPIHNRTNSAARVEVIVPAGDTLHVSDDLAAQMQATGRFADGAGPVADSTEEKPKPSARKRTAKKAADD